MKSKTNPTYNYCFAGEDGRVDEAKARSAAEAAGLRAHLARDGGDVTLYRVDDAGVVHVWVGRQTRPSRRLTERVADEYAVFAGPEWLAWCEFIELKEHLVDGMWQAACEAVGLVNPGYPPYEVSRHFGHVSFDTLAEVAAAYAVAEKTAKKKRSW